MESMNNQTQLVHKSATEIAKIVRERQASVVEIVQAHLNHIKRHNPTIKAINLILEQEALSAAKVADEALVKNPSKVGLLHGVPITLKDAINVAGVKTTLGMPQYRNYIPKKDAEVVSRLKDAGAILLGRTAVPIACWDFNCRNPIYPETLNHWDRSRTPGGSSGGAAASIAAGFAPLDLGSDLAGSIRIPAHCCGVYGLRTTDGLLNIQDGWPEDFKETAENLVVCGPMARNIADLQLMLKVLQPEYGKSVEPVPNTLRIGYTEDMLDVSPDAGTKSCISNFLEKLRQDGHHVVSTKGPEVDLEECLESWGNIGGFEFKKTLPQILRIPPFSTLLLLYFDQWRFGGGPLATYHIKGFYSSDHDHQRALEILSEIRRIVSNFFRQFDVWILPILPIPAFERTNLNRFFKIHGERKIYSNFLGTFNCTTTVMGTPGLAIPIGFSEGMPIGIQVHSRAFSDFWLLKIAEQHFEKHAELKWPNGFGPSSYS